MDWEVHKLKSSYYDIISIVNDSFDWWKKCVDYKKDSDEK